MIYSKIRKKYLQGCLSYKEVNVVLLHYKCKLHSDMLVFSEHSITNHKSSFSMLLSVLTGGSGELKRLVKSSCAFLEAFCGLLNFVLACWFALYHEYFQIWQKRDAEPASEQCALREQAAAYLFHCIQEAPVTVHHQNHREHQAEDEETDDVGRGLCWLWGPAHWTACACTFYPIAAPSEQRQHAPEQGINPGAPNSQQSLAVIIAALVAQGEGAVALVGQQSQRHQWHDACNETNNTHAYFHHFPCAHSKSQESRWFFFYYYIFEKLNVKKISIILYGLILTGPGCSVKFCLTQIYLTLGDFYTWQIFIS